MTLDIILEEIKKANTIVILTHESPDGDAIGSSLAMEKALRDMGKEPDVIIKEYPRIFNFLPNANKVKEETDVEIRIKRLLWSEECFWEWKEKQAHNIAFYYLIEECESFEIPDNGEFISHKDNCNVLIGWLPIEEIKNITIYPKFLKEEIYNLNEPIKHFVSK